jgi:hypothetical protein
MDDERLAGALALAAAILRASPAKRSLQRRQRDALRRLKANPGDDDAWAELFTIEAGRRRIRFDSKTRELTASENRRNRDKRRRTDHKLNAALLYLVAVYERTTGPVTEYDDGDALAFIGEALKACGAGSERAEPTALRKRLARLRKSLF